MTAITKLKEWLNVEKDRGFRHKHDNYPEHPIGVKYHSEYFRTHTGITETEEEDDTYIPFQPSLVENKLREASITSRRELITEGATASKPEKVTFDDGSSGIFKSKRSEKGIKRLRFEVKGDLYKKEAAAYELSKLLGIKMVPPTITRKIDGDVGSVQEFIEGATPGFIYNPEKLNTKQLRDAAFFDVLIGNTDRHSGNFLIKDDKIILIDHGFAFPSVDSPEEFKSIFVRSLIWIQKEGYLDPDHTYKLEDMLLHANEYQKHLSQFLSTKEIHGVFDRAGRMLENDSYRISIGFRGSGF